MKEATGEVSMTMVTIVAVAVIGGILALMWPQISGWISNSFNNAGSATCPTGTSWNEEKGCCMSGNTCSYAAPKKTTG